MLCACHRRGRCWRTQPSSTGPRASPSQARTGPPQVRLRSPGWPLAAGTAQPDGPAAGRCPFSVQQMPRWYPPRTALRRCVHTADCGPHACCRHVLRVRAGRGGARGGGPGGPGHPHPPGAPGTHAGPQLSRRPEVLSPPRGRPATPPLHSQCMLACAHAKLCGSHMCMITQSPRSSCRCQVVWHMCK